MPSSTYNETKSKILRGALRVLGNRSPSNDEMAQASDALNILLKEWDEQGTWVWTVSGTPTILTLQPTVDIYSPGDAGPPVELATDILEVVRAEVWVGGKPDYQVAIRSQKQWMASVMRKDGGGQVLECYFERGVLATGNKLHFAPTPSSAQQVRYYFKRRIYDFDGPDASPDLPQQWLRTLKTALAAELGPEYGLTLDRQGYLDQKAAFLMRQMTAANEQPSDPTTLRTVYF